MGHGRAPLRAPAGDSAGWGGLKGVRVHAPYKTIYKWGYLHEALEVDGERSVELLFTPATNQDIHAVFLRKIAQSDLGSQHVVIMDQVWLPHEAER